MSTIRVVSQRASGTKPLAHETLVDITRMSILGNPFPMKHEHQRSTVIAQFEDYLRKQWPDRGNLERMAIEDIAARVKAGQPIALECWCAPLPCHGDVIKRAVEGILARG